MANSFDRKLPVVVSLVFGFCLPASAEDVWKLSQDSKWTGKQTVFVAPTMMRVQNEGFGFNSILDHHKQNVNVYSEREKMRYTSNIHTWGASIRNDVSALHDIHLNFYNLVWKKGALTKRDGLLFRQYTAEGKEGKARVQAVASVCEDIKTAPSLYKSLSSMYGFPACEGMPVQVVFNDNIQGRTVLLRTTEIKKLKPSPDLFKVPMNYKLAHTAVDVILGGSASSMVEDFANSLGDGVGAKKKKSPN